MNVSVVLLRKSIELKMNKCKSGPTFILFGKNMNVDALSPIGAGLGLERKTGYKFVLGLSKNMHNWATKLHFYKQISEEFPKSMSTYCWLVLYCSSLQ